MALRNGSRYLLTDVVEVVDELTNRQVRKPFVDLRGRVSSYASDDKILVVGESHGWANLGVDYLRDANAWWAIADMSGVVDPFDDLETGVRLRCPSVSRYLFDISPEADGI